MAWILEKRNKLGQPKFWIRDIRDGRQVVIEVPDFVDRSFAQRMLEQYESRRKLENHGYDDQYASPTPCPTCQEQGSLTCICGTHP